MTNDQLKAELAEALADNKRLREALSLIKGEIHVNISRDGHAVDSIELNITDNENPYAHKAVGFLNHSFPELGWFVEQSLSNPFPTGYGAAMLRVVDDAKAWEPKVRYTPDDLEQLEAENKLLDSVQALKELESK